MSFHAFRQYLEHEAQRYEVGLRRLGRVGGAFEHGSCQDRQLPDMPLAELEEHHGTSTHRSNPERIDHLKR